MALNCDETQLAIGCNDNMVSIWDLTDIEKPQFKLFLPHSAAVKAVTFCPWAKSLLATGGGSRDRTIRFWHSSSGTLLSSLHTCSQVTTLNWSNTSKQIVATFGFGENPSILTVYSYPDMKVLSIVPKKDDERILSTTMSIDHKLICTATNDSTLRVYKIWDHNKTLIPKKLNKVDTFGSSLIELYEGVDNKLEIR